MQMMKKKKSDAERQYDDYNEFKSNEDKYDSQYKKEKERKKKKLSEEGKSKEYNEFERNEGEDDTQSKKRKKKLSTESKSKEYEVFEKNEAEGDASKERKKKKLSEEDKCKEYNEFENNEGEDGAQGRKRKKKKLSKESKSKEYNVFERNEGEDGVKDKKKKNNMSEEAKSKEYNELESNEVEDDAQGKKKKLSKESKSEEYNVFERNEGENDAKDKKKKRKKHGEEGKSKEYNEFENNEGEDDAQGKKRKKRKLSKENRSKEYNVFQRNGYEDNVEGRKSKKEKMIEDSKSKDKNMMTKKAKADNGDSPNPAHSGLSKPKRVTFSDEVEVCCDGLVRGKRFTQEEDEQIKLAVYNFIESRGLGDEGLDMVLHCRDHREVRCCWKEIAAALPHRPMYSVYTRAHILFERSEKREWTPEEYEFLRKVKEQHGSNWKQVADALGKNRMHVKDAWRRVKLRNTNKGRWTQEEYQKLFDLVNLDLRVRASQGYRKSKHGMLRDNIGWEAIGEKLVTRNSVSCCHKWYDKLRSPMVATGAWSDTDDYRLVDALYNLDACCMEEVNWDDLLEHRTGEACRKRWNQIVRYIGEHGGKSFAEQVEILAKRYCPNLLEEREAFDAKPLVC
ncbi:transcription termination factor 1 [Vigna unguiculata]|uniref:Transcription termination factor 1 n=1 Tax=Vigna unguiculata TaxID=3917 RepID=A0A4D6MGS7_VIGUN|nr:transcription termination factor 1 [Vigna unguiculata]QCD99722.1 transcription termination factor 1 [Vigna unguiculata]